jgi:putative SOS response-associated peptidase YedK
MCGRYELDLDDARIARHLGVKRWELGVKPRYNVAPSQTLPIITEEEPEQLTLAEWGLLPRWAKPGTSAKRPINARGETIDTLRTFKQAFQERRCLVPATAFYEWQKTNEGKQPYRIALKDNEPFAFAGLYEAGRAMGRTHCRRTPSSPPVPTR